MFSTLFSKDRLIRLNKISSTNDVALGYLAQSPPEGTTIQALEQSSGRGQQGNHWEAESGKNLLMSIILYPSWLASYRLFDLNIIVSLAIAKSLLHFLPKEKIAIKWPNDLLVNRKKICGILIENQLSGHKVKSSIVGIGLNVNQLHFADEISHKATSIRAHVSEEIPLDIIRDNIMGNMEELYLLLKREQIMPLRNQYLTYLWGFEKVNRLMINGEVKQVYVKGVDEAGRLIGEIKGNNLFFNHKEVMWIDL